MDVTQLVDGSLLVYAGVISGVIELAVRGGRVPRKDGWLWSLLLGMVVAISLSVRAVLDQYGGYSGGLFDEVAVAFLEGGLDGLVLGLLASGLYSQIKSGGELVAEGNPPNPAAQPGESA